MAAPDKRFYKANKPPVKLNDIKNKKDSIGIHNKNIENRVHINKILSENSKISMLELSKRLNLSRNIIYGLYKEDETEYPNLLKIDAIKLQKFVEHYTTILNYVNDETEPIEISIQTEEVIQTIQEEKEVPNDALKCEVEKEDEIYEGVNFLYSKQEVDINGNFYSFSDFKYKLEIGVMFKNNQIKRERLLKKITEILG